MSSLEHHPGRGLRSRFALIVGALCFALSAPAPVFAQGVAGTWLRFPSNFPPTSRFGSSSAYDPLRHRVWVFGGFDGAVADNQLWSRQLDAPTTWTLATPGGAPPLPRLAASMIYDPVGDRLIVFGGSDGTGGFGDTWELDLGGTFTWIPLTSNGTPPSVRNVQGAIYDPVRLRMILFGGFGPSGPLNDCWALDLSTPTPEWSQLAPVGTPPAPRSNPGMIYDPVGDRIVIFGGSSSLPGHPIQPLADTWVLSLAGTPTWTLMSPAGSIPPARTAHGACYDAARGRLIVAGGRTALSFFSDAWALDLTTMTWGAIAPGGKPLGLRSNFTMDYDPVGDRAIVYGGRNASSVLGSEVSLTFPGAPAPLVVALDSRLSAKASYDAARQQMVVFGGILSDFSFSNQTGIIDLSSATPTWKTVTPLGTPPPARSDQMQIVDPVNGRLILFGGKNDAGYLNDVWQLTLTGTPTWSHLSPFGTIPLARQSGAAVYDPVNQRMLILCGIAPGNQPTNSVLSFRLDASPSWLPFPGGGLSPSPRYGHSAVYDPARQRIVMFGGTADGTVFKNDVWLLALDGTWTQLVVPGGPSPREGHLAVFDAARDRMVVCGGYDGGFRNDSWQLSFAGGTPAWTQLLPDGGPPAGRDWAAGIADPLFDRMVLFGGNSPLPGPTAIPVGDAWTLQWSDLPTPALASLVDEETGPGSARLVWFTPDGAGVSATVERSADGSAWETVAQLTSDGSGQFTFVDRVEVGGRFGYRLAIGPAQQRTEVTWLSVPSGIVFGFDDARPNPSRGGPVLSFSLADGGAAALEVVDVRGRRVFARDVTALGPGHHALDLKGALPHAAGVYLVSLRQAGRVATRKFALLP